LRRIILAAIALLAIAVGLSTRMRNEWEFTLLWGLFVGAGTGVTSLVLAAVVAARWFDARRGLVMGALSAANATGQLVFLPLLASLVEQRGWRSAAMVVAAAAAIVFVIVLIAMRDRPEDMGLLPYGREPGTTPASTSKPLAPLDALALASRSPAFWVLAGSFFICGASTNGLIGTHLIPACHDYGISEVRAAGLLAMMGIFDIIGTTASGWLTDRFSSRHLLFAYYTLRGLSLLALPLTLADGGSHGLGWFALFYGLDWVATVPPTVRLTSDTFGRENTGVVYGWIGASHQLGASMAAFGAGTIRTLFGDYRDAFWIAGVLCFIAGFSFVTIGRRTFLVPAAAKI
jgi:sugar phosphate permease